MQIRIALLILILILPMTASRGESEEQNYIVRLRGNSSIEGFNKKYGTRTLRQVARMPIYLIRGQAGDQANLKAFKSDLSVDLAEKDLHIKLASADDPPIDSALVQQMASLLDGHTLTTFYGSTVLQSYIDQPAVHITRLAGVRNISTGAGTRVAYIDTGVDFDHPALRPWLEPGVDSIFERSASEFDGLSQQMASLLDQQMASLLDKRYLFSLNQAMASLLDGGTEGTAFPSALGHGTLVAGIIHLVAPEARIVPIKAFDSYGNTTMFSIVEGIYRATEMNVDVINMSFSIGADSDVLRTAVRTATAANIAVVASVGNNASDIKNLYPAAYPHVIGVAATDFSDRLANFSNYGKSVSITAPGAYVVSTVPGGRYAAAWGTSFSAPIVSGAAALLASLRGYGQSDSMLVLRTADSIDGLNPERARTLGSGRINIQRALDRSR